MKILKRSWSDITISDYRKIVEISSREYDSEMEKGIAILAVLCGVNEDDVYSLPIMELKSLMTKIGWIYEPYTFNKNWNAKHIVINGEKYDVCVDINKFTVAQYADFQIYWDKRQEADYMAKVLSTFIIPSGKKYNDGYDVIELISILENNISINDWNSMCYFFLQDCLLSIKASLYCSVWEITKTMRKEKNKERKKELREMRKQLVMQINNIGF